MSYIRLSSTREYSEGEPMYVFKSAFDGEEAPEEFVDWQVGNPSNAEDLAEVICRVVTQAGINLSDEEVNKIRDRLGLEDL